MHIHIYVFVRVCVFLWFTQMCNRRTHVTWGKSTLVQVMAWYRQATSYNLSQCWPQSMSPHGVTRPKLVTTPHKPCLLNCPKTWLQACSGMAMSMDETSACIWTGLYNTFIIHQYDSCVNDKKCPYFAWICISGLRLYSVCVLRFSDCDNSLLPNEYL